LIRLPPAWNLIIWEKPTNTAVPGVKMHLLARKLAKGAQQDHGAAHDLQDGVETRLVAMRKPARERVHFGV